MLGKASYQRVPEVSIKSGSSKITKPLNLKIDPDIIKESKEQQNAVIKKSDQLLANPAELDKSLIFNI